MTCWLPSPRHGFCHGGLADIDAKLEQFAVDPRRSPKRVRDAHVANPIRGRGQPFWVCGTDKGGMSQPRHANTIFRKSYPHIAMVQSGKNWRGNDRGRRLPRGERG
jgi:hypothetical protein